MPALHESGNACPTMAAMATAADRIIRHRVVRFEAFLPPAEAAALYDRVLASEPQFVSSRTHDENPDIRRSLVLDPPAALVAPVVDRVRAVMPQVLEGIRLPEVTVGTIEAQVTASGDGSFFGIHTDAGYAGANDRRHLTYVYYLHSALKGFEGGELRVYDDVLRNNKLARSDSFQVVAPQHNSIVFFWTRAMHEVRPVRVASRAFRDSRFTVNGWVNKA